MRACTWLHDYRDGLLQEAPKALFETHLTDCAECRKSISLWTTLESELREMDREGKQSIPRPSASTEQALLARARGDHGAMFTPRLVAVAAALALVIVGVALYLARTGESPVVEERDSVATSPSQDAAVQAEVQFISPTAIKKASPLLSPGDVLPTAESSRTLVRLGRDRIGFDEPTVAVLTEVGQRMVRLKLLAGAIACEVAPRGNDQTFIVDAGEATVQVVGTRFMVSRADDSTTVLVDEGVVEVHRDGKRPETTKAGYGLEVLAGGTVSRIEASDQARAELDRLIAEQQLELEPQPDAGAPAADAGADASPDRTPRGQAHAPAGVETWRGWILAGRYDDAERSLTAHLARNPNDSEALMLLASCRRKAGRWRAAVSAYERVIQVAGPSRANMARFKAGVIYQERLAEHASAARSFDGYLRAGAGPKPMQPEAMLRLGKSLLALGRTERARAVLEQVAARQDGNPASLKARELLEKITGEK